MANMTPEQEKPWKYVGYPGFTEWMASADDFLLVRRFGQLNVRAILLLQDRIVRREEMLKEIDELAAAGPDEEGISNTLRFDPQRTRQEMLDEMVPLLKQYNDYLVTYSELKNRPSAQEHQIDNIKNWFKNHPLAVADEEQEFVNTGRDLIPIASRQMSYLSLLVERSQPLLTSKLFKSKPKPGQAISPTTLYYKKAAVDSAVNFIIIFCGLLLLIGPMWTLQFLVDNVLRLAIITAFIVLFTGLLSSATVARPFEVLAATAAYAAVLMVFLQLGK